jgi:hypothetical protein
MTEREANRTNVEDDDCSEEQSSDKTGLEENRNKVRARTSVRNQAEREEHSAGRPENARYRAVQATPQRAMRVSSTATPT